MAPRIPNLEEHLLVTAAELIGKRGVEALSLRELGRLAGVSRGAPYYYFADKRELVARIGELGFRRMGARIDAASRSESGIAGQLHAGLRAYVQFALDEGDFFDLMFASVLERSTPAGDGAPAFAYSSTAARDAFTILSRGIEDAQRAGQLRGGDPLLLGNALWAYAHGVAVLARGRHLKHDGGVDAVFDAGFDALLAPHVTMRD